LCALVFELISRPFADMGVCDDGPYVLMAHNLATTGHVSYNGWAVAMIGWQLYLGAAFIRLFGFSFTIVRSSTLLVSLVIVYLLQRTFVRAAGVPDTSLDSGWEYNLNVELHYATHINDPHILVPAHSYVPPPPGPGGICSMPEFWREYTPHIHPVYSVSFDPDACYGLAPFAPVHYSRWMAWTPGTLYAIRSSPPATP
jgi:hypothetical protein